jgi:hypothetical protein
VSEVTSYYGRPVLKPPVWDWRIAAYFFTGGLSAGSAVLAAGADLTGHTRLRRAARLGALGALLPSTWLLVSDLGRPERFHHMLRVAKPTSPMSVGSWLLAAYGPGAGLAALNELAPPRFRRDGLATAAGLASAALAPALASYTGVLLSQTAVPAWHDAYRQLPFVFTAGAAVSAGGLAMVLVPPAEAGPARRLALLGAAAELGTSRWLEHRPGITADSYRRGTAASHLRRARGLLAAGLFGAATVGRRSRIAAAASGLALLAGAAYERFGIFEAGRDSAADPAQVILPQRTTRSRGADTPAEVQSPRGWSTPVSP